MKFLSELNRRNTILYYLGWIYFVGALICLAMTQISEVIVLNINAWVKPMKFAFSIWIFSWTMGWILASLNNQRRVKAYSWAVVVVMIIEQAVITWQAANGRLSHFNISTPFYRLLFIIMGIAITTITIWTAVMGYYFFKQKQFSIPSPYVWSIRLAIIIFVVFAFEGGIMAARYSHSVGGADGGPGLPIVNWSKIYGDLRVAHFIGIHSLQVIPLFGFYIAKTNRSVQLFAVAYFMLAAIMFIQAFQKIPLLN